MVRTRYAGLTPIRQDAVLRDWSRALLAILRVEVRCYNAPESLPERCLLVANHVSWLDIFAVYAAAPGLFVAKSEIRHWPVVGGLVRRVGTLFIERGSRRHARRTNERIVAALENGRLVAVCPEGTTTDGRSLRHFHAALLQPAIDARALVLPVALRFVDGAGAQTDAPIYVGEMSLVESVWRIASTPSMAVELRFAPYVNAEGHHRRDLTRRVHGLMTRALGLELPHAPPGRVDGQLPGPIPGIPHCPHPASADPG
ncbi:MAG TPA: lysophospholipid acyltransferase family protein [Burkholderiales bacterium]|nr:lysophospholipid acyltransferase family protein [Burkholderiales bacterium]